MKINKRRLVITIGVFLIAVFATLSVVKEYRQKTAVKIVSLKTKTVEVYEDLKVSDLISFINGDLVTNPKIDTTSIGKKEVDFEYKNYDNIKINYSIEIKVVDKTKPIVIGRTINVEKDSSDDVSKLVFCGDNYDRNPKCYIKGKYDLNKIGTYNVKFIGEDSSNNKSTADVTIVVKEKSKDSGSGGTKTNSTNFDDVIEKYKNKDTNIGIDISHWQGDINYKKVKKAGVEFVYIRVGRGNGVGAEYVLDDRFIEYIKGFNKVKVPVGVYFYSNANSKEDAEAEAKWILKQIKKYDVDLEIVFDWENWNYFQEYDLNFHDLTEMYKAFEKVIEKNNHKALLYGSKYYLEEIFDSIDFPVWLAHYTENTDYSGEYKVWQICSNGKVDGIDDNLVDINIMKK